MGEEFTSKGVLSVPFGLALIMILGTIGIKYPSSYQYFCMRSGLELFCQCVDATLIRYSRARFLHSDELR